MTPARPPRPGMAQPTAPTPGMEQPSPPTRTTPSKPGVTGTPTPGYTPKPRPPNDAFSGPRGPGTQPGGPTRAINATTPGPARVAAARPTTPKTAPPKLANDARRAPPTTPGTAQVATARPATARPPKGPPVGAMAGVAPQMLAKGGLVKKPPSYTKTRNPSRGKTR